MLRRSSTWLSSAALACLLLASPAGARVCLPPVFEGGQRLQPVGGVRVFWLDPLLRQHEICWRSPGSPEEKRVVLLGNSAVVGFPHPVEDTFGAALNRRFEADGTPAHLYNLGFNFTHLLKEALILEEALGYEPDVLVYAVTLDDLERVLPIRWAPMLEFLVANRVGVAALARAEPAGLSEPFAWYAERHARESLPAPVLHIRQLGRLARAMAREWTRELLRWRTVFPDGPPPREPVIAAREDRYDCAAVEERFAELYQDWQGWNMLAYLEEVSTRTGVTVLVVNWPVAHEPQGACYSARYPTAALEEYRGWLRRETNIRGLAYVDLQDLLPAAEFVDSLHPGPAGHEQIADALEAPVRRLLGGTGAR